MSKLVNTKWGNMKDIQQGTDAWHEHRRKGIGASDAASVMGISPWKTRLQLWEEKTGRWTPPKGNWATQRGTDMEPKARATWELTHNIDMPPTLAEHQDYPFIKASLDGYNKDEQSILEIKCPGKKAHAEAVSGKIPDYYYPQLMHQFIATGAKKAYYYSFDGEEGVTIEVLPDEEYCQKLLCELIKFWKLVETDTPPEPTDKDFQVLSDESLSRYCTDWKVLKAEADRINELLEDVEEKIRSGLQVPRAICSGVKLVKSSRRGAIDYGRIEILKSIDLEQYRKPASETFRISILKETK